MATTTFAGWIDGANAPAWSKSLATSATAATPYPVTSVEPIYWMPIASDQTAADTQPYATATLVGTITVTATTTANTWAPRP